MMDMDCGISMRLFHCVVSCRVVCRNSSAYLRIYLDAIALIATPKSLDSGGVPDA